VRLSSVSEPLAIKAISACVRSRSVWEAESNIELRKKSVARKVKRRTSARTVAPRKAKRGYDIHTGPANRPRSPGDAPTTRLTERYIGKVSHQNTRHRRAAS
jgi:hypothetical protein